MSITLEFSPADMELIQEQAKASNRSAEDFIREAAAKSARNAAYLARIDRATKNLDEGRGKFFTDEELEALFNGNSV
ncbi:MAG TPA: hypothetical protein DEP57_05665 [Selenomonas sp.]|nr:hypothetical protein [Selenomonadaceae bacterium]HCB93284.1 hypothetical protein [Selenomonas sp.]